MARRKHISESRYGTHGLVAPGLEPDFPVATFGAFAEADHSL